MTPAPPYSPSRTPPPVNTQFTEQVVFQPVQRAQENLIFAIKNVHEDEFDRHLDQALLDGALLGSVDEDGLYPLELAVIAKRPRIVRSLLMRGAPLPVVANDGFDLVMLAARNGHSALVSVLIDFGSMLSDAQDSQGLTPLHHAVLGGHLQAAMTLLDREADIDIPTTDTIDSDICEQLRLPPSLVGSGSTPLMLAVSKGDLVLADLLLSWQADMAAGARHPLEIAVINHDDAMIDLFIQKGIDPVQARTRNGQSLLSFAVEQQCSLSCVKKLLPPGTHLDDHSATATSPLRIAIRTGQHEVAAYLLCQGAQAESANDMHQTTWEFADNLPDQGKMTRILVATRCTQAVSAFIQSGEDYMGLYQLAGRPAALAVRGFFPELVTPLAMAWPPLRTTLHLLTPAQQAFEIAYVLMRMHAPDTLIETSAPAPSNPLVAASAEQKLIQSIPEKIMAQKKELYEWAKKLVDKKLMHIPNYYSRHFLISMMASCPQETSLSTFMMRKLREKEGFPDNLSEIIVSAWIAAEADVSQWHLPGADADRLSQCKEYYAVDQIERTLFLQIQKNQADDRNPPISTQFSYKVSGQRSLPANQFAQNPVIFLYMLEHPLDRPALDDAQLKVAFCLETGFTPWKSGKIIDAWRHTRQTAERRFVPSETERRHHFSCISMASALKSLLPPQEHYRDGTLKPMPSRWETQLHRWCDLTLAANNPEAANTSAEDDPEQSRPLKRARYQ